MTKSSVTLLRAQLENMTNTLDQIESIQKLEEAFAPKLFSFILDGRERKEAVQAQRTLLKDLFTISGSFVNSLQTLVDSEAVQLDLIKQEEEAEAMEDDEDEED